MKKLTTLFAIICLSFNVFAQAPGQTDKSKANKATTGKASTSALSINGLRFFGLGFMIFQLDGKDFNSETDMVGNNILKFRLGAEYEFLDNMFFHIEFQDARMMYHDANVVTPSHHYFELFQGYIELKKLFGTDFGIKAGRFQMGYGTEKYIGKSFWHINERKFDGVKLQYATKPFVADLFYTRHKDITPYMLKTTRNMYPLNPDPNYGNNVFGLWSTTKIGKTQELDIFAFSESKYAPKLDVKRNTMGLNYGGKIGAFSWILEFAYELGKVKTSDSIKTTEKDMSAYQAGLKLNYKLKPIKLFAGFDIYSGTDPNEKTKINTFTNELGSKHKFLGYMDYFLVLTAGTGNLGVNDYFLGVAVPNICKGLTASLTGHYFMSNQTSLSGLNNFGNEFDLVLSYKLKKRLMLKGGASMFMQGNLMEEMWKIGNVLRTDPGFWTFLMLVVKI
jgi:hypothetical protein